MPPLCIKVLLRTELRDVLWILFPNDNSKGAFPRAEPGEKKAIWGLNCRSYSASFTSQQWLVELVKSLSQQPIKWLSMSCHMICAWWN